MSRSLAVALASLVLAALWPLILAGIDRAGSPRARLAIEECRLDIDFSRSGLVAALAGRGPLALAPASHYAPESETRPLAERVAALGVGRGPRFVHVAIEANGPAVAAHDAAGDPRRPPVIRDFSRDAGQLRERYAASPAIAITHGVAIAADGGKGVGPQMPHVHLRPRQLALTAGQRALLHDMPPQQAGVCRSRFLAIVEFGNLDHPTVEELRTISAKIP